MGFGSVRLASSDLSRVGRYVRPTARSCIRSTVRLRPAGFRLFCCSCVAQVGRALVAHHMRTNPRAREPERFAGSAADNPR